MFVLGERTQLIDVVLAEHKFSESLHPCTIQTHKLKQGTKSIKYLIKTF